jgi:hypothetical protein
MRKVHFILSFLNLFYVMLVEPFVDKEKERANEVGKSQKKWNNKHEEDVLKHLRQV